jgi:hypothetical protein
LTFISPSFFFCVINFLVLFNASDIPSALNHFGVESLENARLVQLTTFSVDGFKAMLAEKIKLEIEMKKGYSVARLRWIKAIHRVLIQNYVQKVKVRLGMVAPEPVLTPRQLVRIVQIINEIHQGLGPPYVNWRTRKMILKLLKFVSSHSTFQELTLTAEKLNLELFPFLSSKADIEREARYPLIELLESLKNLVSGWMDPNTKILPLSRMEATQQLVREVVNEYDPEIKFSLKFEERKGGLFVTLFLDNASSVKIIKDRVEKCVQNYKVKIVLEVEFSIDGSPFRDARLECQTLVSGVSVLSFNRTQDTILILLE